MSNNFWDEDENASEYEMIEETIQNALDQEPAYFEAEDIEDEMLEEINHSSSFDLDERESVVIYNANLRLEQANLYRMLINHNLFEGVDASGQAIKNVQDELKAYITERLEILLGMKKERLQQEQRQIIESHFNDIEISFLRQLAYKGTKGKSEEGIPVQTEVRPTGIKPLSGNINGTLKPLSSRPKPQPQPIVRYEEEEVEAEPLPTKPKAGVRKKRATTPRKRKAKPKTGLKAREMTQEEIERLAREDLQRDQQILSGGNFKKLTASQKAKRIAKAEGSKKKRPSAAAPMPSQDQINMHFQNKQQHREMSNNKSDVMLGNILAAVAANKKES